MANYATKSDLKNATGVDTSEFDKKSDLASLKSGIRKLGTISANLSGLSNAVEEVVKKTLYDELDIKVKADINDKERKN